MREFYFYFFSWRSIQCKYSEIILFRLHIVSTEMQNRANNFLLLYTKIYDKIQFARIKDNKHTENILRWWLTLKTHKQNNIFFSFICIVHLNSDCKLEASSLKFLHVYKLIRSTTKKRFQLKCQVEIWSKLHVSGGFDWKIVRNCKMVENAPLAEKV